MVVEEPPSVVSVSPPKPHAPVEIRDGLVYKRGEREALEMEALRTCLAAEVGERTGRFLVPPLRMLDFAGEKLATEYIPHLLNLQEVAMVNQAGQEEVFRAAGRALATVHQELELPPEYVLPLPDYLRSEPEDEVPLHGDFCWSNVCWQPNTGRVVLLDWASAPLLGRIATYGCRYFDLLWFSWSLFYWMPPRRVLQWRAERLIRAMGSGYAEVESRFRWQRYVQYRRVMWPLSIQYWKGNRAMGASTVYDACAQLLGWLRWRCFPSFGGWK